MKSISRLKRAAALFGVGAVAVGGMVIGATQAQALTQVGSTAKVLLSPASGSTTTANLAYSSDACPTGNQGSGQLRLFDPNSTTPLTNGFTNLAAVSNAVASPFSGTMNTTLNTVATGIFTDVANGTAEIGIECFTGPSGTSPSGPPVVADFSYVHFSGATGVENYLNDTNGPAASVTVTLTANPTTGTVGQSVSLKAVVSVPSATGSIQFEDTSTATPTILATVPLSGGQALSSFTPSAANATGEPLKAVYVPSGNFTFSDTATDAIALVVNAASPNSGSIPLAVVVPSTGVFQVTIDTKDWVQLIVTDPTNPIQATANTTNINVVDTRNNFPGWSVSGQSTQFSGTIPPASASLNAFPTFTNPSTVPADHGSQTIAANQLGWTPNPLPATPVVPGLTPGAAVAPVTGGLGTSAQVLASVHAATGNGFTGTAGVNLTAALTLAIPANQEAGPYAGDLNITSVSALP